MSWPTVIWSMAAAACLTLAVVHAFIWVRSRRAWANFVFSVAAVAVAGVAFFELSMMHAQTPEEFGTLLRWVRLPVFALTVALVAFVRLFLRAGRPWLGHAAWGVRLLVVIVNFSVPTNLNYVEMTGLKQIEFLGESVAVPEGIRSSWSRLSELASLLFLVFVLDASIACWRRGDGESRRRALTVGGSIIGFTLLAPGHAALLSRGLVQAPYFVSFCFLGIVLAMGYELSRDIFRAGELSRELTASEQRMDLAIHAAGLGPWAWDVRRGHVWASEPFALMFGLASTERIEFDAFLSRVHPDDRAATEALIRGAVENGTEFETEFRALLPDGTERWISAMGKATLDDRGEPALLRAVCLDVTTQKRGELEIELLRTEAAHVSRVSVMGQLASALAHELSQPLGAILRNAEAAELLVKRNPPDLEEVTAILGDIREDDHRASNIIAGMRALLKRRKLELSPVRVGELMNQVIALTKTDAVMREVKVQVDLADPGLLVQGDRVHLQQVLLNLMLNGMDAMRDVPNGERRVVIKAHQLDATTAEVSVADVGHGIEDGKPAKVFEPFYTTKSSGMGMGLAICRTLVEGHGGQIWAKNNADGGATFRFTLPLALPHAKGRRDEA